MATNVFFPTSPDGYRLVEGQSDYEIYLGHRYSAFYSKTITSTAGTNIVSITSNSEKICEAWFSIETDKAGLYELYEDAVVSSGSVLTAINNNRNSLETADCTILGDPTVSTVGEIVTDGPGIGTVSINPNATTSGATTIVAYNNNENSSVVSTLTHTVNGAYTSSGTVLYTLIFGGTSGVGVNKATFGSTSGFSNEVILAPSSVHLVRFVADTASCRTVIRTSFYKQDWV